MRTKGANMDGLSAYREHAVVTQSPGRLIVMLYEGAIRFLQQAITAMENKDFEQKAKLFARAMDIINELDFALNMEEGGEIAMNLHKLYGFMRRHLTDASIKMDTQRVRDVIACLEDLNEGWKAVTA